MGHAAEVEIYQWEVDRLPGKPPKNLLESRLPLKKVEGKPGEEWRWNHHKRMKRLRRWMWCHRGDSAVEEVRAGDIPMNPTTATEEPKRWKICRQVLNPLKGGLLKSQSWEGSWEEEHQGLFSWRKEGDWNQLGGAEGHGGESSSRGERGWKDGKPARSTAGVKGKRKVWKRKGVGGGKTLGSLGCGGDVTAEGRKYPPGVYGACSKVRYAVKAQAKGGGTRVEASSENASHQASFITRNGGSAHAKVNGPKEGAAPVPAAEPKSSSETAAVTLTPAGKRPAKKGMPKRGGSSRGRLVYRPKKSKKVIAKKEEEEPKATGEPGVADEAPLPETGANGGPNTDQSSELCCGPLEPMKLQRRRFQRLKSRSFLTLTIRMMTMMG